MRLIVLKPNSTSTRDLRPFYRLYSPITDYAPGNRPSTSFTESHQVRGQINKQSSSPALTRSAMPCPRHEASWLAQTQAWCPAPDAKRHSGAARISVFALLLQLPFLFVIPAGDLLRCCLSCCHPRRGSALAFAKPGSPGDRRTLRPTAPPYESARVPTPSQHQKILLRKTGRKSMSSPRSLSNFITRFLSATSNQR
jgi:hypothetical protein